MSGKKTPKIPRSKGKKYTNNKDRVIPLKSPSKVHMVEQNCKQILADIRNISKILEPIIRSPKRFHMIQCNYAVFTIVLSNTCPSGRYIRVARTKMYMTPKKSQKTFYWSHFILLCVYVFISFKILFLLTSSAGSSSESFKSDNFVTFSLFFHFNL